MNAGDKNRPFAGWAITGLIASIAGSLISAALIMEYFGVSIALTDTICRAGSDINACRSMAKSVFAAIREVPIIGDVPTAIFGFVYYGYASLLFISALRLEVTDRRASLRLVAMLSLPALSADLFLFVVSALFIKAFCPLCMASYAATLLILSASLLALWQSRTGHADGALRSLALFIRKRLIAHGSALFLIAGIGLGIGMLARSSLAESMARFGSDERVSRLIARYEAVLDSRIDIDGAPFDGSPGAPVRVVVFSDFNCSSCTRMNTSLKRLLEERPDDIVIYYMNFPLGEQCRNTMDHRKEVSSCLSARAALCAGRQGKYGAFSAMLYLDCETGVEHDIRSLRSHARRLGLDKVGFESCMGSPEALERVREDRLEGERLLVDGTPTLFVNNRMLDSADIDPRTLRALIEYITTTAGGNR